MQSLHNLIRPLSGYNRTLGDYVEKAWKLRRNTVSDPIGEAKWEVVMQSKLIFTALLGASLAFAGCSAADKAKEAASETADKAKDAAATTADKAKDAAAATADKAKDCLLYTSPSPRDRG